MKEQLHICAACGFEYESAQQQLGFHQLEDEWQCPTCGIEKLMFHHYACDEMVAEMMGGAASAISAVELPHLSL